MSATFSNESQAYLSSPPSVAPWATNSSWSSPPKSANVNVRDVYVCRVTHSVAASDGVDTVAMQIAAATVAYSDECFMLVVSFFS